ncbi:hypothetical protein GCM10010523_11140 [Paenarthrobacter ilicis]
MTAPPSSFNALKAAKIPARDGATVTESARKKGQAAAGSATSARESTNGALASAISTFPARKV